MTGYTRVTKQPMPGMLHSERADHRPNIDTHPVVPHTYTRTHTHPDTPMTVTHTLAEK